MLGQLLEQTNCRYVYGVEIGKRPANPYKNQAGLKTMALEIVSRLTAASA